MNTTYYLCLNDSFVWLIGMGTRLAVEGGKPASAQLFFSQSRTAEQRSLVRVDHRPLYILSMGQTNGNTLPIDKRDWKLNQHLILRIQVVLYRVLDGNLSGSPS